MENIQQTSETVVTDMPIASADVQEQPTLSKNRGLVLTLALIIFLIVGLLVYIFNSQPTQIPQDIPLTGTPTSTSTATPTVSSTATATPTPTPEMKSYTSSQEKLTFTYPDTWQVIQSAMDSTSPNGDTHTIKSPSGKTTISWISAIDGLGGNCEPNCPTYEVYSKQQLPNSHLYYVEYLVTVDGVKYGHTAALQDSNGILTTQKTIGYLLFKGKNNGKLEAGLIEGVIPYGIGINAMTSTKAEAQAFFSSEEGIEAKNILLSAKY